ncbi:prepilin-type N-terminal cleavage/methylation domain-containing protein [Photobacterium carnosum]|uniref:type II secretion system protein n=1 Tax=Photobacterium carnosum TaxID=2023717 RepID=UPI001E4F58BA|nr:prepilin-type N-terminal cleavage/methylation domain-containing protein [Photobacterium carnosum]MCD9545844.1 prepilin-type N-terminal cleavage/methylation domain-containing protein [Photobacterium carnosum]MCD9548065.1 prepilin-type N-terminal cleavage/methylation domain-containing protein [Photobacterium carnosum]MCF2305314.1 prepilin-type N-terminal cleavage/methylation domain-containing protein [Photobacterium carnosum]
MKKNGFTLIELVVVIVILGILAVVAAPKFMNLQVDARNAALKGLKGAIASGLGIGYAKMAIAGLENLPYVSNTDTYPGLKIDKHNLPFAGCSIQNHTKSCTFINGYPDGDSTSLELLVANLTNDNDWKIIRQSNPQSLSRTIKITFSKYVTPKTTFDNLKNCYVLYTPPISTEASYTLNLIKCS